MPTIEEIKTWQGGTLTDREGEKIGSIDEVYVDRDSGEPEWLAVKTGLFGSKLSFVPVAEATRTGEDVRVPYEKAQVKDAPRVDADGELSDAEEADLYRHYGLEYDASSPSTGDAMTRSEEELQIGTRQRESGTARLRKYVVTEQVQQTVPVQREEVRIEREPITDANRDDATAGADLSEDEHEITLHEEEVVVDKQVVPKEQVRLEKDVSTEQREVTDEVRKEQIEAARKASQR